jgi:tRNA (cmo5U34)-methyltransferase
MTDPGATPTAGWHDQEQVDWYLHRIDRLAPRMAGEAELRELLPPDPRAVLDLGCGDGRLTALVLEARPETASVVAVDLSAPMLEHAHARFDDDPRVEIRRWDLNEPVTPLGSFDVVVTGFAVHHLDDDRKQALLVEIGQSLRPGGLFANLEIVASATPELHAEFLAAIGRTADDPEDRLVDIETQLDWMRAAGLTQVDCLWRWRGMALLAGRAPRPEPH